MKHLLVLLLCLLSSVVAAPAGAQPRAGGDAPADARDLVSGIVGVRTNVPQDAHSAATLGTHRDGSGVIVREGYIATIGYLVIEAESIEVTGADGKVVPAVVAGYDHATGFGLLRLLAPLAGKPIPLGDADALGEREPAMIVRHGAAEDARLAFVVSRRPFFGGWEYQLDSAIFTYPAVTDWSGAALISARGELVGIGSLVVNNAAGSDAHSPGNMFVPVNLLAPILDDLIATGRRAGPARPWLGMYTEELRGHLLVTRVSKGGPAEHAGVRRGDIVLGVGTEEVTSLGDFYSKVWARGAAGVEVPLRVLQGTQMKEIAVRSMDRLEHFRRRPTY